MTEHKRIWLEPAGAPDRCWCQDNQWGEEGVEYVHVSEIERLRRENAAAEAEVKRYRESLHMISAGHGSPIELANNTLRPRALASTGGEHHAE